MNKRDIQETQLNLNLIKHSRSEMRNIKNLTERVFRVRMLAKVCKFLQYNEHVDISRELLENMQNVLSDLVNLEQSFQRAEMILIQQAQKYEKDSTTSR